MHDISEGKGPNLKNKIPLEVYRRYSSDTMKIDSRKAITLEIETSKKFFLGWKWSTMFQFIRTVSKGFS
jgi:hypothetical protein